MPPSLVRAELGEVSSHPDPPVLNTESGTDASMAEVHTSGAGEQGEGTHLAPEEPELDLPESLGLDGSSAVEPYKGGCHLSSEGRGRGYQAAHFGAA